MHIRLFLAACLAATIFASTGAAARPITSRAASFDPQVSVWISDDTPGSHGDITTTIDVPEGPLILRTETLTPAGGGIHRWGDIPEGNIIGWIGGFSTIPASDGRCNQRFLFNDVPLVEANPDAATFPPFLRALAPGQHRVRYTADVAGTPVNIIIDDVRVDGVPRLRATTFLGDPAHLATACAPFRSRVIMLAQVPEAPVGTAPPTSGMRSYDFTFTARPDASGNAETAHRTVTAVVQPGPRVRIEGSRVVWDAVPGAASYVVSGPVDYATTCALLRRLVDRQAGGSLGQRVAGSVTSVAVPPPPSADYELAQVLADVTAYDADGVLLARGADHYIRDFKKCWYPPGEEPLLHVSPQAGSCIGDVTFTGERFPPGVTVELARALYGSDGAGPGLAVAPVAADGTFSVTATLPQSACLSVLTFPGVNMIFVAYNADEPRTMASFARVGYAASLPPGWTPPDREPTTALPTAAGGMSIGGPATGSGPDAPRAPWQLAVILAAAGAMVFGCGIAVRRTRAP